ncbi:MAG: hypothetical protein ACE5FN_05115 [Leptospirillia bacterium]
MDEIEAGKAAFIKLLAEIDPEATAVIPSRATADNFLISLTTPTKRVFITLAEDDLIDLAEDDDIVAEVREKMVEALGGDS